MTIKSIINNWYKELFWMGVGSVITLAAEKVVRTIKEKRQERDVEESFQKFAHDASKLWQEAKGSGELEIEEEDMIGYPDIETAARTGGEEFDKKMLKDLGFEDEPVVKVDGLDIISQDEFEDMQSGPDIHNRFELVYDQEHDLFGYENGIEESDIEDDLNIRGMFHYRGAPDYIIKTLCDTEQTVVYGALSNGDIYICVRLGLVEEVK